MSVKYSYQYIVYYHTRNNQENRINILQEGHIELDFREIITCTKFIYG